MVKKELKEDIFVRYGYILARRYTKKQRLRAAKALEKDLRSIKKDVKVDDFDNQGLKNRNIYFGNIKKAKRIIATYYDTPSSYVGDYYPLDKKIQSNRTLIPTAIMSVLYILIGLIYTVFFARKVLEGRDFFSSPSILIMVSYFLYFILFKKILTGFSKRKTLIRNSSSIFFIFNTIIENEYSKDTAFAFLDSGVRNNAGLERLSEINSRAEISYLDSIGAENPLLILGYEENKEAFDKAFLSKNTLFITAAKSDKDGVFIEKDDLEKGKISIENLESLYKKLIKGEDNV